VREAAENTFLNSKREELCKCAMLCRSQVASGFPASALSEGWVLCFVYPLHQDLFTWRRRERAFAFYGTQSQNGKLANKIHACKLQYFLEEEI
jgi:hypothetical protein